MISQAGARARIRMFGEITREGEGGNVENYSNKLYSE